MKAKLGEEVRNDLLSMLQTMTVVSVMPHPLYCQELARTYEKLGADLKALSEDVDKLYEA